MTLKFEVKLPSTLPFITRLVIMMQNWSWCLFWQFWGRRSQKNWNKSRDLDGWFSNSRSYIYTIMTFHISGCIYGTDKISVSILTFSRWRISKKTKLITWPWQMIFERQGQTHFYMTFLIFGCIHDTDIILVSILTKSRSMISNEPKLVTWPWRLTFKIKVKPTISWPSSFLVVYMI